jgi:hypothetical protein
MSSLQSVLDELIGEAVEVTRTGQLQDDVVGVFNAIERLRAEALRRVAELDRRQAHLVDGHVSCGSWLRNAAGLAASTAREHVRVARALVEMPMVQEAHSAGDVSFSHVRLLATAWAEHPAVFAEHEETLVDAAAKLPVREFRTALEYWRQTAAPEAAHAAAEALHAQRRLHLSSTFEGAGVLDALLDREGTATVKAALWSFLDPAARAADDERTPAQVRADALVELSRFYLDHANVPVTGGERPHLTVLVGLEALEQRAGRLCELGEEGVVTPETALRLACDAAVSRVITKGQCEPLDVGRKTRTVSPAIRKALVLRDGGCRFPGCRRPPRWSDAHHIEHWIDGGPTSLGNLVLLCRYHHRLIHECGFTVGLVDGQPEFRRPDGTVLMDRWRRGSS